MNYNDYIRFGAGAIQFAVACYALRLNRLFRARRRIGWSLFGAFLLLALLFLTQAFTDDNPVKNIGLSYDAVYLFVSLLLLVGMAHIEIYVKAQLKLEKALELRVNEKTQDLTTTNKALRREIAARANAEQTRRDLEEQLRQAQKMEAVGQLAGGIAHDFNNLLTVIGGYVQMLRRDERDPHKVDILEQVSAAANRAANLTRQMLTFSRRNPIQAAPLNLNDVIENLSKMLRRIIGEDIALQSSYGSHLPLILADSGMMEQLLMNLVVNARDAMPCGGTLAINTALVNTTDTHQFRKHEARAGQFVCLTVRDTGCGMTPETFTHLFEPFFTTKEVGKGTGLGLATVYGIVKQHSGWVEVDSKPKSGTEFRIYFPATTHKVAPATNGHTPKSSSTNGRETILVVEDEPGVLELTCLVLRDGGYKVIEADCGMKALDIWKEQSGKIDLVLTDMVMPGNISGRELATRLRKTKPDLKVMFVSGYSPTRSGEDSNLLNGLKFIPKPYDPGKLLEALRGCLDGNDSADIAACERVLTTP